MDNLRNADLLMIQMKRINEWKECPREVPNFAQNDRNNNDDIEMFACFFVVFFFQEFITKLYDALMCVVIIFGIRKVRFGGQEIHCATNFLRKFTGN